MREHTFTFTHTRTLTAWVGRTNQTRFVTMQSVATITLQKKFCFRRQFGGPADGLETEVCSSIDGDD